MGGDEALAFLFIARRDFAKGVRLAVRHSGDSDSTGTITGNILGALLGKGAILRKWFEPVELRKVIKRMGMELNDVEE